MQKQIIIYALEHKFILNYIYNIEKIQGYYVVYTTTLGKGKIGFIGRISDKIRKNSFDILNFFSL